MVLFISMVITSTAPSYAAGDFGETSEASGSEGGGDENGEPLDTTPATTPEDTTGNSSETTGQEPEVPGEPVQSPNQGDAGNTPGTVNPTDAPAGAETSPSVEPGETMPSTEPGMDQEGELGESPTPTPTPTLEPTASPSAEVELVDRIISSTAWDNALVEIDGLLPEDATVSVTPVTVSVDCDGQIVEAASAYDITIYDKDGQKYKVTEDNNITVTISGTEILEKLNGKKLGVYHMKDKYAAPDSAHKVADVTVEEGSVTFEAESFSVYALVDEQTTQTYENINSGIALFS